MEAPNSDYRKVIEHGFAAAPFIRDLGITLKDCGPGWIEAELTLAERHLQQNGFPHGGLIATLADHCAGGATVTLCPPGHYALTLEFKTNFLKAARTSRLTCRADVLKPGKSFTVVEACVFAGDAAPVLLAKTTATLAIQGA
jgi:uncharacterized protein (TIGR00369 family)